MPKVCHGVIEIRLTSLWWHGAISIGPLIEDSVPSVTGPLFDVDNLEAAKPVASRRGIPDDASFLTTKVLDDFGILYYNATWILPEEIRNIFKVEKLKKGWSTVFAFMDTLEEQYGDGNVRLVAWFT